MFSVKNIVQNVKLIELWGKNLVPLHFTSVLKWCIHRSRSLYLYFNYLASVTAGGPESPRGHM